MNKTIQARKMPQKDIFIIKDSTLYYIVTQDQLRIRTWIWDMVLSLTTPVSDKSVNIMAEYPFTANKNRP